MPVHHVKNKCEQQLELCLNNPMLAITVRMLRYTGSVFSRNFLLAYVVHLLWLGIDVLQLYYICTMKTNVESLCLNALLAVCVLTSVMRSGLLFLRQTCVEEFFGEFVMIYKELQRDTDPVVLVLLEAATKFGRKVTIALTSIVFIDTIISVLRPLLYEERQHPFNTQSPFIDFFASPAYEMMYIFQLSSPYALTMMYTPFVNIFASCMIFAKMCLQVLQHRLFIIYSPEKTNREMYAELLQCIAYYERIKSFVNMYNDLVTYLFLCEIIIFSMVLCFLFYCLAVVRKLNLCLHLKLMM